MGFLWRDGRALVLVCVCEKGQGEDVNYRIKHNRSLMVSFAHKYTGTHSVWSNVYTPTHKGRLMESSRKVNRVHHIQCLTFFYPLSSPSYLKISQNALDPDSNEQFW
jgi:hypothetical protein